MRVCSYEIDAEDRLVAVDEAWCAFAEANGAAFYARPANLCGQSLWSFISDGTTRHIYHVIVTRVRRLGRPITVPFRCDAPLERRWFELRVESRHGGGVRFESDAVRTEPREAAAPVTGGGTAGMIKMCSWCKDVETDRGWEPVERAVARLGVFGAGRLPDVTHGICGDCARKFEGDWLID